MKKLIFIFLFAIIFQSLSMPVYDGLYKRDTSCATGCDCWDEAQITFQDEYAVPVFFFNGTFNGNCEGQMRYAESNYTYQTYYEDNFWYYFWQDEQNGYLNVTGGPFCSYGNYTITTSTSYWNNETQYWQKNLMIINDQHPQCSYHMKNITGPAVNNPIQPVKRMNNTSPYLFQGTYNRSESCSCCCWDQVSITYEPWFFPNYQFNGSFSGSQCGWYYDAIANLTFYGTKNQFHSQLNQNYLNLDGSIGDYQYYYNSINWTIFKGENQSIIFSDKINPQCSYTMMNVTNYMNNNYYNNNNDSNYNNYTNYNNDTDYNNYTNYNNDTDYSNNTNDYAQYYDGEYGPVQNITNPRVLNGFYNLSGQCPSDCYCWNTVNITFQYDQNYLGYYFGGYYGPFSGEFYNNFSMPFDGSWEDLVQDLSYQFVNLTNYTIYINYYNNYSDEYYNYGKRASEIQMTYLWNTNCTFTLARNEGIYDYNSYINTTTNYYQYNNQTSYNNDTQYDNYTNYNNDTTYSNDTQWNNDSNNIISNYTPAVYSPYDFDGYYTRTTNCGEGCCCFNFVTITYSQIYDYYNLFMFNGTYSGSGCPSTKYNYPINFTYTGPNNMFLNYTSQGFAPFIEGWIGYYGSNYTLSLNITNTNDYIQIYNVDQPQCTYYLENITYYVPQPTSSNNNNNYNNYTNGTNINNYTNYSNYTTYTNYTNYTTPNTNNTYDSPSTDGVFDYFDGNYRINTPCTYTLGCSCWNDVQLTNFDADSAESYFILNGTYRDGSNTQYVYKSEQLYYPYQGMYASQVTLNSENNNTVITINTGNSHYNPNTQYWYNDIQIINDLNPNCSYNLTNMTGLNGYDEISNSIQLQIGKLKGKQRN